GVGKRDLPADVLGGAPLDGDVLLAALALAGGAAPRRPVVGDRRSDEEGEQQGGEGLAHGIAPSKTPSNSCLSYAARSAVEARDYFFSQAEATMLFLNP